MKEERRAFRVDHMQRPRGGQQYKYEGLTQGQCIWSEGSEAGYGGRRGWGERAKDQTKEDPVHHGKGMVCILRVCWFYPKHYLQRHWASRMLLAQAFGGRRMLQT